MAMINGQEDVPGPTDTVVGITYSKDRAVVWVKFASGKTLCAHIDTLTAEERAAMPNAVAHYSGD